MKNVEKDLRPSVREGVGESGPASEPTDVYNGLKIVVLVEMVASKGWNWETSVAGYGGRDLKGERRTTEEVRQ